MPIRYFHCQCRVPRVYRRRHFLNLKLRRFLPHDGQYSLHDDSKKVQGQDVTKHEQLIILASIPHGRPTVWHQSCLLLDDEQGQSSPGLARDTVPLRALR